MNRHGIATAVFFIFCLFALRCSTPENPYLNANLSMAEFTPQNFSDGDTIAIFGEDSIGVTTYLREHVANLTVTATKNRLWADTIIGGASLSKNMIRLPISFWDTGWQALSLVTHKLNGDSVVRQYRLYTVSPLHPTTLRIMVGDTTVLKTSSVASLDRNVKYVWDLRSATIKTTDTIVNYVFDKIPSSTVGDLYITDNTYRSPSAGFRIEEATVSAPHCVINNAINDTVFTAVRVFPITGTIAGAGSVAQITLNDVPADFTTGADGNSRFGQDFTLTEIAAPTVVVVKVFDSLGSSTTLDTFFIKYKPSSTSTQPTIVLMNPQKDTSTADNKDMYLWGLVFNSQYYPAGVITCTRNGNPVPLQVHPTVDDYFGLPVPLDPGYNSITVKFIGDTVKANVLTTKSILVNYDPNITDMTGPVITVLYNGTELPHNPIFRIYDPKIDILLLDNSPTGVILVNGVQAVLSPDSIRHLPTYTATLSLSHPYTTVTILANDIYNNQSSAVYDPIRHNRPPQITIFSDSSDFSGAVGEIFTWKTTLTDPDGDPLRVTATVSDTLLYPSTDGIFRWIPEPQDTGLFSVRIEAWDQYEMDTLLFDVAVSTEPDNGFPVKWATDTSDVPGTLVKGEDTLAVTMQANPRSNQPPFSYLVEFVDISRVLYEGTDSMLLWIPDSSIAAGLHTIKFTITDRRGNLDFFYDVISITNPIPASVDFLGEPRSENESISEATFTVKLSKTSKTPVTVVYAIDTAASDVDSGDVKLPENDTLVFAPGEQYKSFTVKIIDDAATEQDETMVLYFADISSNAQPGLQTTARYTIEDNDHADYSFVNGIDIGSKNDYYTDTIPVAIALSQPLSRPVSITCSVVDDSTNATSTDYTFPASSKTITIAAGAVKDTTKLLLLPSQRYGRYPGTYLDDPKKILGLELKSTEDCLYKGNITYFRYLIGDPTEFTIDDNTLSVQEGDIAIFSIRRSDTILTDISIYFQVNAALTTATEGVDYKITTSNPLVFAKTYLRSKQLKVTALDDNIRENYKKVVIDITGISVGGVLMSSTRLEVGIIDND